MDDFEHFGFLGLDDGSMVSFSGRTRSGAGVGVGGIVGEEVGVAVVDGEDGVHEDSLFAICRFGDGGGCES